MAIGWYIYPKRPKRRARSDKSSYRRIWQAGAEAERQRIALDLHDTVIQTLYTANLLTNTLYKPWEETPGEERESLAELSDLMQRALDETRVLLLELRSAHCSASWAMP